MSDVHILEADRDNRARVVMHVAIPNVNNAVGVNYRTALVNSGLGGETVLPDGLGTNGTISAAEKAQVLAGEVYEHVEEYLINPVLTANQNRQGVMARYATVSARVISELQQRLNYFGHTEDEA